MATLLAIARQLAERYAFRIIPVDCSSKQPAVRWKEFQQRRSTEREWRKWFLPQYPFNLGIITGAASGIVVVDADSDAGRGYVAAHLPPTPMRVMTGRSGGEHHYYRHPGGTIHNKVRLRGDDAGKVDVDVRGDGGFVIGPGSKHPRTGRRYAAPAPWPPSLDALPVFDPAWVTEPAREPPRRPPTCTTLPMVERARRYLAAIPPAIEGQGGDAHTFMVTCKLVRGFVLDDADALELLREWNQTCVPPWSERELIEKINNAHAYGSEAIGGRCS